MSLLSAAALLWLAGSAGASDFTKEAVATTGSEFLTQDMGARGIALGGAYSAVTDDVYSLYWNPAGLAFVPRVSAAFMYTRHVEDINSQSGALAWRLNDTGVVAGGWRYRDAGEINETDVSGAGRGTFRPRDYIAEIGWGQRVFDLSDGDVDVAMGVAGRWLHSRYVLGADSYSGDIGIHGRFYTARRSWDLSFAAQNIGVGQKFDKVRDTLPFRARFGAATRVVKPLLLSIEALLPSSNSPQAAVGAEYTLEVGRNLKAAIRGGFNSLTAQSLGVPTTASAGVGLTAGDLTFDYAFVPFGVLGADVHRFSISFNLPAKTSRRYRER